MEARETWLQWEGEPAKAFAAFAAYRDLGSERSLNRAAKATGLTMSSLQKYCSKWSWVERARAYDLHLQTRAQELLDARIQADVAEEAEKWRERRQAFREKAYELGLQMMKRAEEMLRFPLQEVNRVEEDGKTHITIKPVRWNANSIVHTLRLGLDLQTLSTGLVVGSHPLDDVDWDQLSTEQLEAILQDRPIQIPKKSK